jgi:hypothetical protein
MTVNAPCHFPGGTLVPFYFPGGALPLKKFFFKYLFVIPAPRHVREPPKVSLNVLKLMGKHFIDPKRSEILSVFQVFPCTMQIALFWPKLLPVLFFKKP